MVRCGFTRLAEGEGQAGDGCRFWRRHRHTARPIDVYESSLHYLLLVPISCFV